MCTINFGREGSRNVIMLHQLSLLLSTLETFLIFIFLKKQNDYHCRNNLIAS